MAVAKNMFYQFGIGIKLLKSKFQKKLTNFSLILLVFIYFLIFFRADYYPTAPLLGKVATRAEGICGVMFHPLDNHLAITFGKGHLVFWTRRKDGFFDRFDMVQDDRTVTCLGKFLNTICKEKYKTY